MALTCPSNLCRPSCLPPLPAISRSPVGAMLQPAPGDPTSPMAAATSPRAGLERALLFVSAGADGTVRLWSGVLACVAAAL